MLISGTVSSAGHRQRWLKLVPDIFFLPLSFSYIHAQLFLLFFLYQFFFPSAFPVFPFLAPLLYLLAFVLLASFPHDWCHLFCSTLLLLPYPFHLLFLLLLAGGLAALLQPCSLLAAAVAAMLLLLSTFFQWIFIFGLLTVKNRSNDAIYSKKIGLLG